MRFQGAVLREQGQTFAVVVVQRHVIDNQSTATEEPIRFRMEQAGLTPRDLIPFVGSRAKVSELLSSRRVRAASKSPWQVPVSLTCF
jgi:antitoxin component HigA of HigAB toxin-antitoxin module